MIIKNYKHKLYKLIAYFIVNIYIYNIVKWIQSQHTTYKHQHTPSLSSQGAEISLHIPFQLKLQIVYF